ISGGRVFILSSDEVLHAYDLATGERLWEYKRKIPDYITQQELSTPTVDNDRVYCGFADGSFVAIEAETGAPIWVRDLSGGETESTDVDAQPIIDEERIYITSFSGGVFALNRESGEVMWRAEMKGASTVVRSDDLIYTTTSRRHVVALNPNNGKRIWRIRHQRATPTIPMALDDYLLYGSTDGGLYVLDRNLGLPIVKFDPDVGFNAPLTVQDNRVFVFSNHGVLYAFEVKRAAPRNDFRLGRRDSPRP
ncbi:MAG: PQQ-binding-like beta-propeller repeat protein, partial [Myxococcota bacterium]